MTAPPADPEASVHRDVVRNPRAFALRRVEPPAAGAALWTAELGKGYAGPVTTLRAQLRAAIAADPRSEAQIARDAGMEPAALSRLLREDKPRDGAISTWERVAAALGLRVALVKDGHGAR